MKIKDANKPVSLSIYVNIYMIIFFPTRFLNITFASLG